MNEDIPTDIVLDNENNIYVTGWSYAETSDAVTIKYSQVIGIKPISNEIPEKFSLSQNYPNPFNPTTKIRFSILLVGAQYIEPVQLIIYDILGHEVATLVNENLQPGTYEVTWDASNYSSGIYYYKFFTGDAFYEPSGSKNRGSAPLSTSYSETKKMLMIK